MYNKGNLTKLKTMNSLAPEVMKAFWAFDKAAVAFGAIPVKYKELWLIVGAPEETEFLPDAKTKPDMSLIYPVDPKQLPKELAGVEWPPKQ